MKNAIPSKEIEQLLAGFQYGHFDGMTDMYEYSNGVDGRPQTKYLFVERHITPEIREKIKTDVAIKFGITNPSDEQEWFKMFGCWSDQRVWTELRDLVIK